MHSNTTHSLNIAVTPSYNTIGLSLFNTHRTPINQPLRVQGKWVKRGNENQSNQFQLFRVPFKDLQRTVPQSILPHIYRSYVRLQEYCPNILRTRYKRKVKIIMLYCIVKNIIVAFKPRFISYCNILIYFPANTSSWPMD